MYSILIATAVAIVFAVGGMLVDFWSWGWAIFLAVPVFLVVWVPLARRFMKQIGPAMQRVQERLEARKPDAAMAALREMLPLAKWVPLLRGQLFANMGMIAYRAGDQKQAVELLSQSTPRAAEGQLVLACIQYRDGDKTRAFQTLKLATAVNKKHALLHNAYAWLLNKEGRVDEAIALLAKYLQKHRIDEIAKDNLLRLQNRSRMSMKDFGLQWYALGFEHPPAEMGQMAPVRKGFRTPPKRKG